jgi:hypothetical protein
MVTAEGQAGEAACLRVRFDPSVSPCTFFICHFLQSFIHHESVSAKAGALFALGEKTERR